METIVLARKAHAYVILTAYGLEVHPPVEWSSRGSRFKIRNMSSIQVNVTFPADVMKNPHEVIRPNGGIAEFTVRDDAKLGVFDYEVGAHVIEAREAELTLRARGGSDPRIIIDF
jgi:hypothetical protein